MDALIIGAIILGIVALVIIGSGLSDYQIVQNNMAHPSWNSRLNTYDYGGDAGSGMFFKFGVGTALGIAGLVLYLLNRSDEKQRKSSPNEI